MNVKMNALELKEHIVNFLKEHKGASLATCMDNIPRSSPVQYFVGQDMDIYIVSAGGQKFNAIEQNPNVCLLVNTEYINYRKIKGVQIFGKAAASVNNRDIYDEAMMFSPEPYIMEHERDSLNVIKIVPEEIVYLDSLEKGERTKQILKDDQVMVKEDTMMPAH